MDLLVPEQQLMFGLYVLTALHIFRTLFTSFLIKIIEYQIVNNLSKHSNINSLL